MTGQQKVPTPVRKTLEVLREERLAAALRENLRRRKVAKKRDASLADAEDDEGTLDDRD
jgi:hypothetical protein